MGVYNAAVITTAGEGLIAQAVRGTEIQWTYMRSSSTAVTSDLKGMTAIPDVQQTAAITDALVYNNSTVQVTARFSNTGISAPYYIRTVGIFAQLDNTCEGLIPMSELPGYFVYDERTMSVRSGSLVYRVGDRVKVRLEEADMARCKLRFSLLLD